MNNFCARLITGISLILILAMVILFLPKIFLSGLFLLIFLEILVLEWPKIAGKSIGFWLFGLIYLGLSIGLMIWLNHTGQSYILYLILITVPASDIGAYLVGKSIGKHKLCPKISPNKTWEGFAGGCLAVFIVLFVFTKKLYLIHQIPCLLIISIIITTLATLGDLFESWLKRRAGIKDSGNLLPGHGGLLDRVDSFTFVVIFTCMFKVLFKF